MLVPIMQLEVPVKGIIIPSGFKQLGCGRFQKVREVLSWAVHCMYHTQMNTYIEEADLSSTWLYGCDGAVSVGAPRVAPIAWNGDVLSTVPVSAVMCERRGPEHDKN